MISIKSNLNIRKTIFVVFSTLHFWGLAFGQTPNFIYKLDNVKNDLIIEENTRNTLKFNSNWGPEIVDGVNGNAIRFDGYSTYISGNSNITFDSNFSLSCFIALETYPANLAGVFSIWNEEEGKGIALCINKQGQVVLEYLQNGLIYSIISTEKLNYNQWHQIGISYSTNIKEFKLYLDGEVVNKKTIQSPFIFPINQNCFIGTTYKESFIGKYRTNTFSGILDDVAIYDQLLSQTEWYNQYLKIGTAIPNLQIEERFANDITRPIYHAIPQSAWTNEPHALININDTFHLFYQKNANGPYWNLINWGHLISPDLVTWFDQKIAIKPSETYDNYGVWSGHAVIDDNKIPTIFYTGVNGIKATINLARSFDQGKTWQKEVFNPIISNPPGTYAHKDFRDPFVWKENNIWYMIIGSGLRSTGSGGTVFWYKSLNLKDWQFIGPMLVGHPDEDNSGEFWEMPLYLKFKNKKDALLVVKTPQGNNPANAIYWVGENLGEYFVPSTKLPKQLELINHFLAPCILQNKDSTYTAIGIIPDLLSEEVSFERGWAHLFSLPRIWDLNEKGEITQKPHPNLKKLRGQSCFIQDSTLLNSTIEFSNTRTRHFELKMDVDFSKGQYLSINFAQNDSKTESTTILFNGLFDFIEIDKTKHTLNPKITKGGKVQAMPIPEKMNIHLFVDGSVVECFLDNEIAFSTRIFPTDIFSDKISISTSGTIKIENLELYQMRNMSDETLGVQSWNNTEYKDIINFYPNPSENGEIFVGDAKVIKVVDRLGRNIPFIQGNHKIQIENKGLFFAEYLLNNTHEIQKIWFN